MTEKITAQRIAMKAIVYNDEHKVLIMREAGGTYADGTNQGSWLVPGGRLNVGEHWQEGLLREVREETGLEVEAMQPLTIDEWRPIIRGVPTQIVAIFILCRAASSSVKLSDEHDKYKWLAMNELDKLTLNEHEIPAIEKAFEMLERGDS